MILRGLKIFSLVFLAAGCGAAAEHFVSPSGRSHGSGSIDDPWTLELAFSHPPAVSAGDTIYLRGGIYRTPRHSFFKSGLVGAPGAYITVQPYRREHVRIDGGLEIDGAHVIVRDLEVMNSQTRRTTLKTGSFPADMEQPAGITAKAPDVKVINNVVHDTGTGLASWKDAADNEFYGNIVFNNGWQGPDRPHGHGAYMQNRDGKKLLIDNIVFNQFELGLQIYGTATTFLNGFYLEGNVLFNNGALGGRYSRNLLIGGGVVAQSPTVIRNWTYYPLDRDHGGENNIGYYAFGVGCSDLRFEDNYFASGSIALTLFKCSVASFKNNVLIGSARAYNPADYPGNQYLKPSDRPAENRIFVRPNRWEEGRANLIVFNWKRESDVKVDVRAAGLKPGDSYEIRDVQNLFGDPVVRGVYQGGPVVVPMTGMAVTQPIGEVPFPAVHTDREFGVFLLRRENPHASPAKTKTADAPFGDRQPIGPLAAEPAKHLKNHESTVTISQSQV